MAKDDKKDEKKDDKPTKIEQVSQTEVDAYAASQGAGKPAGKK